MYVYFSFVFFLIGLIFGSFFNVVGMRIGKNQSIVTPSSHCPVCCHPLTACDLIPLVSYCMLLGKCRYCGIKIRPLYPIVEWLTGILFVQSYQIFGWTSELVTALLFVSLLMIIFVTDMTYMIIPNKILGIYFIIFIVIRLVNPLDFWWLAYAGSIAGFSLLWVIAFLSNGGIGGGDIKLYAVIGLVLGFWNTILSLFLAAVIGCFYGSFLIFKKGKITHMPIPFGPAIAVGSWLSYMYGNHLLDWYMLWL